jgi:hypothetical protein
MRSTGQALSGVANTGDHPLGCHWRPVAADAFAVLDLPPARSRAVAVVRNLILAEAYIVGRADPDRWVSYSRRREFYAVRRSRYRPATYTYDLIVQAVDDLHALGLLAHQKMPPGNLGWQSRFKASRALLEALNQAPPVVVHEPKECILLRDQADELVPYKETVQTRQWRRNLEKINKALLSVTLGLKGHSIREGEPLRIENANIGPARARLHRVFNQSSFSLGGRFYGAWWQNIPKAYRAHITINGAPTVEMDYPRLHPTLLYAECGRPMSGDPYNTPNADRRLVKVAFNTLMNADTRAAAIRAIADKIGGKGAFATAEALVREIETKHAPISHNFGSGAGRRLMRQDSDMTEYLLLRLIKRGIVALPVHDSYIVKETDKGALLETMAKTLHKLVLNNPAASTTYSNNIPQYGASSPGCCASPLPSLGPLSFVTSACGPPAGSVVVFFPALFGSPELSVLASEVLNWRGGLAPAGIPRAVRHELQRRSLRHADLADRVGVSGSQFSNILRGRFGASSAVAQGIRDFLIEGAKTVGISVGEMAALAPNAHVNVAALATTDPNLRLERII